MKFTFEITEAEYREATAFAARGQPDAYAPLRRAGAAAGGLGGAALLIDRRPYGWVAPALLAAFGLFVMIYPLLRRPGTADDDGWAEYAVAGPQTWEVTEQVVAHETAFGTSRYGWHAFTRIAETPSLFLLYYGGTPMPVPKRAFPDPDQLAAFRSLAQAMLVRPAARGFPVTVRDAGA